MEHHSPKLAVSFDRKKGVAATAGFVLIAALGCSRALDAGNVSSVLILAVFLGLPGAWFGVEAARGRARLIVDATGLTFLGGNGAHLDWGEVAMAEVQTRQGAFDLRKPTMGERFELALNLLAPSPDRIVEAIRTHSNGAVAPRERRTGLREAVFGPR